MPYTHATEVLRRAAAHLKDREATYDSLGGERSMQKTVEVFNALTGLSMNVAEGWLFMLALKLVRQQQTAHYHPDSGEDAAAYAALFAEEKSMADNPQIQKL